MTKCQIIILVIRFINTMQFLFRWLDKKLRNTQDNKVGRSIGLNDSYYNERLQSKPVTFKIYKADGGHVVEVSHYDRNTDEHSSSIYIISSEQDFGEKINHILTVEAIKN